MKVSAYLPVICTVLAFVVPLKATQLDDIQQKLKELKAQGSPPLSPLTGPGTIRNNFQASVEEFDEVPVLESQLKQELYAESTCNEETEELKAKMNVLKEALHLLLCDKEDAEGTCNEETEELKGKINALKEALHLLLCDKEDVDRCVVGAHNCDPNANCTSTRNGYSCTCRQGFQGDGYTCIRTYYRDCKDAYNQGVTQSGVYTIDPSYSTCTSPLTVFCDMDTDGGGWIIFQRRIDNSVDFAHTFAEYEEKFGDLESNFWLGLKNLHCLTASADTELRIDMTESGGETAYAKYSTFSIGDSGSNYKLSVSDYSGTAGDGLIDGTQFSTYDRDNDNTDGYHCSAQYGRGGWWYDTCYIHASLNGEYLTPGTTSWNGIYWYTFKQTQSFRFSAMKLRQN